MILEKLASNIGSIASATKDVASGILKAGVRGVFDALEVKDVGVAPPADLTAEASRDPGRYSESQLPRRDNAPLGLNLPGEPVLAPLRVARGNDIFSESLRAVDRNIRMVNDFAYGQLKKQNLAVTRVDKKIGGITKEFDALSKNVKDLALATLEHKKQIEKLLKKSPQRTGLRGAEDEDDYAFSGDEGRRDGGGGGSGSNIDLFNRRRGARGGAREGGAAREAAKRGGSRLGRALGTAGKYLGGAAEVAAGAVSLPMVLGTTAAVAGAAAVYTGYEMSKVPPNEIKKRLADQFDKARGVKPPEAVEKLETTEKPATFEDRFGFPKGDEGDTPADPKAKAVKEYEMTRSSISFETTVGDISFTAQKDFKVKSADTVKIESKTIILDAPNIIFTSKPKIEGDKETGGEYGETGKGGVTPTFRRGIGGTPRTRQGLEDAESVEQGPATFNERFTGQSETGSQDRGSGRRGSVPGRRGRDSGGQEAGDYAPTPDSDYKGPGQGQYDSTKARANFMQPGEFGRPGENLTSVKTAGGHKFQIHKAGEEAFTRTIEALEKAGAPLGSIGGYSPRPGGIAGKGKMSQHAMGNAMDLFSQTGRDTISPAGRRWINEHPKEFRKILDENGMVSGGDWRGGLGPDLGHIEWSGRKPWLEDEHGRTKPQDGTAPVAKESATPAAATRGPTTYSIDKDKTIAALRQHEPRLQGMAGSFASDDMIWNGLQQELNKSGITIEGGQLKGDPNAIDKTIKGMKEKYPQADIDSIVAKNSPAPEPIKQESAVGPRATEQPKFLSGREPGMPEWVAPGGQKSIVPSGAGSVPEGTVSGPGITGKTSIAQLEKDPAAQAAIAKFQKQFPNVEDAKTQLYNLVKGESGMGRDMIQSKGKYQGYFALGPAETGGYKDSRTGERFYTERHLSKEQFVALPFHEQLEYYSKWAADPQNHPTGKTLKDLGLFNAASDPRLQNAPDSRVVYQAGSEAARKNAKTWGAYSPGGAGGDITVGGIKAYYASQYQSTLKEIKAAGGSAAPRQEIPVSADEKLGAQLRPGQMFDPKGAMQGLPNFGATKLTPQETKAISAPQGPQAISTASFFPQSAQERYGADAAGGKAYPFHSPEWARERDPEKDSKEELGLTRWDKETDRPMIGYNEDSKELPPGSSLNWVMLHEMRHAANKDLVGTAGHYELQGHFPESTDKDFEELRNRQADIARFKNMSPEEQKNYPNYVTDLRNATFFRDDYRDKISKKYNIPSDVLEKHLDEYNKGLEELSSKAIENKDYGGDYMTPSISPGKGSFADRFGEMQKPSEQPKTMWEKIKGGASSVYEGAKDLYDKIPTPSAAKEAIQEKVTPELKPVPSEEKAATPVEKPVETKLPEGWKDPEPSPEQKESTKKVWEDVDKDKSAEPVEGKATVGKPVTGETPHTKSDEPSGRREPGGVGGNVKRHSTRNNPEQRHSTPNDAGGGNRRDPDGIGLCSINS